MKGDSNSDERMPLMEGMQVKYHASGIYAPGFNFSASLDMDIL
jgi:hypothetical protein